MTPEIAAAIDAVKDEMVGARKQLDPDVTYNLYSSLIAMQNFEYNFACGQDNQRDSFTEHRAFWVRIAANALAAIEDIDKLRAEIREATDS